MPDVAVIAEAAGERREARAALSPSRATVASARALRKPAEGNTGRVLFRVIEGGEHECRGRNVCALAGLGQPQR